MVHNPVVEEEEIHVNKDRTTSPAHTPKCKRQEEGTSTYGRGVVAFRLRKKRCLFLLTVM